MEPRYLTYVVTANLCFVVVGVEDPWIKDGNDGGWYTRGSYLVTEVTHPCVGRDLVRFSGRPFRGVPMWHRKFLSLTICWKS